jgi:serine/threonine-protein phosphatase 5
MVLGSPEAGYTISASFVEQMMDQFKAEKKIHIRFAFEIVMGCLKVLQQLPTLVDVEIPQGTTQSLHTS